MGETEKAHDVIVKDAKLCFVESPRGASEMYSYSSKYHKMIKLHRADTSCKSAMAIDLDEDAVVIAGSIASELPQTSFEPEGHYQVTKQSGSLPRILEPSWGAACRKPWKAHDIT